MKYSSPVCRNRWCASLAIAACLGFGSSALAENLAPNAGFESSLNSWEAFVGSECRNVGAVVEGKSTKATFHEGGSSAMISSDVPIRYGLTTKFNTPIPVEPGEHYKLSAWVKFADDAVVQPGRSAVYLRLNLMEGPKQSSQDPLGHIHVGLKGEVARTAGMPKLICSEVPHQWQKIEGVVEMPKGQTFVTIALFVERITGAVYWDDIVLEKVDKTTPLTPEVPKD